MKGEGIQDDSVWIIKSHSPWQMQNTISWFANKCIVVVRNPLDTNLSWLNIVALNNHNMRVPFDFEKLYPDLEALHSVRLQYSYRF